MHAVNVRLLIYLFILLLPPQTDLYMPHYNFCAVCFECRFKTINFRRGYNLCLCLHSVCADFFYCVRYRLTRMKRGDRPTQWEKKNTRNRTKTKGYSWPALNVPLHLSCRNDEKKEKSIPKSMERNKNKKNRKEKGKIKTQNTRARLRETVTLSLIYVMRVCVCSLFLIYGDWKMYEWCTDDKNEI